MRKMGMKDTSWVKLQAVQEASPLASHSLASYAGDEDFFEGEEAEWTASRFLQGGCCSCNARQGWQSWLPSEPV